MKSLTYRDIQLRNAHMHTFSRDTSVHVCVCVCVRVYGRDRGRKRGRKRGRERERGGQVGLEGEEGKERKRTFHNHREISHTKLDMADS